MQYFNFNLMKLEVDGEPVGECLCLVTRMYVRTHRRTNNPKTVPPVPSIVLLDWHRYN